MTFHSILTGPFCLSSCHRYVKLVPGARLLFGHQSLLTLGGALNLSRLYFLLIVLFRGRTHPGNVLEYCTREGSRRRRSAEGAEAVHERCSCSSLNWSCIQCLSTSPADDPFHAYRSWLRARGHRSRHRGQPLFAKNLSRSILRLPHQSVDCLRFSERQT
jgi:hypothetical protein